MIDENERCRLIRCASLVSVLGNVFIALLKVITGLLVGSLSVLADGIDSVTDVIISVVTFFVSFIMAKPSDKKHPWGYYRAETLASILLSNIIFFAGVQLLFTAGRKTVAIMQGKITASLPTKWAIIVTVLSICIKLLLALNQYRIGKQASSTMIVANAKNMASDVLISASVLVGLIFSTIFHFFVIDSIIAFVVAIFIIKTAIELFKEFSMEMMDGNSNEKLYQDLFSAVLEVSGVNNPHKARIRKIGHLLDIDIDIEVDGNMTVSNSHLIAEAITENVKKKLPNVYDVMIHIEPFTQGKHHEAFGVDYKDVSN